MKLSRISASTAARPWSCAAPTTAKKISVDSTLKLPPITSGLAKSARLSTNPIRNAFASPGRINGQVTVRKVRQGPARNVRAASSRLGLTPCRTPARIMNAIGRERQDLRDRNAPYSVDPSAARNAGVLGQEVRHHAGAAEQQDQREADHERWRNDRQQRQRAQQRLQRQRRCEPPASANARPSNVVTPPTRVARATVFQATPQCPPARQPRLQIDGLVSLATNRAGANDAGVVRRPRRPARTGSARTRRPAGCRRSAAAMR